VRDGQVPGGDDGKVTRQARRLLSGQRLEATVERDNRPLKLAVTPQKAIPIHMAALGPHAVRLAGELADGWVPFLLPLSGLDASLRLLEEDAARGEPRRAPPIIAPCVPTTPRRAPSTRSKSARRPQHLARAKVRRAPPLDEFMPAGRKSVAGNDGIRHHSPAGYARTGLKTNDT